MEQTITVTITVRHAEEVLTKELVKDALGNRLPNLFGFDIDVDDTPSVELVPINDVLPGPFPEPISEAA